MKDQAATPLNLHGRAQEYNWDSGIAGARSIAERPECDRATALLLYWRLSPHYYRRYPNVDEAPARVRDAAALVQDIESRLLSGTYRSSAVFYDPADDGGLDRTRATEEEESLAVRPLPAELYQPCGLTGAEIPESAAERLERGCHSGDADEVRTALEDGAWEPLPLSGKRALLGAAVERDHLGVVEQLLTAGASPRFAHGHRTLLDDAHSVAMIDLLAGHGADPGQATLALAVTKAPEVIRRLVELGTPLDGMSRWGEPAVYRAAVDGHVEVLSALIELGANRDMPRQSDGRTALQAVDERLEALRVFLEHGAPYECPERTEFGLLTSARIALTGDRRTEDARYW